MHRTSTSPKSKSKIAPYKSERNESWLKIKCSQTARYEVIGYKNGVTSLYLAKREGKDLIYVGKAASLRQRLSNYFSDPRSLHPRTAQMVATAESVE